MTRKARKVAGKLLVFDLETSNLAANRGHIICAAAKWVGVKDSVQTWRIDDSPGYGKTPKSFFDDSLILRGLIPLLEEAEAVMAYYGSGFDVPYVNTRAIANKMDPPIPFTVLDPWKTARSHLKLARNDMGSVASLIGTTHQKTHLPWEEWWLAHYGDRPSIDKLLKYNVNDILTLEDIYFGIRPLISNHPYLGDAGPLDAGLRCPACGSKHSRSHDVRRTRTFEVFRRRCTACGSAFETGRRKLK